MIVSLGRRVSLWSVSLALAAVVLAAPAPVLAQFDPIVDLSAVGAEASGVSVAIDGIGVSTVVWNMPTGGGPIVQARRLSAAGVPGPVLDLSLGAAGPPNPKVVADAAGVTTVIWIQETALDSLVQARRIAADGTPGPVLDLSPARPRPAVHAATMDAAGTVMVAWLITGSTEARVGLRQISPAGVVGPLVEVTLDPVGGLLQLGLDAAGNATVAWMTFEPGGFTFTGTFPLRARRIGADGSLGPIRDVATLFEGPFGGAVALVMTVDPSGPATLVARTRNTPAQQNALVIRRLAPDGTLGPAHSDPCYLVTEFDAVSAAGVTTLAMECVTPFNLTTKITAQQLDAADQQGPALELISFSATPPSPGRFSRVVADGTGRATVLWVIFDGTATHVQARQILPGGLVGNLIDVAILAGDVVNEIGEVDAAVDATGLATVAWTRDLPDGVSRVVQAAHGTVPVFADVTRTHSLRPWVEALFAAGITGGCGVAPLVYCPDLGVRRDQMAVFLVRGMHGAAFDPPPATGTVFTDVPADYPLAKWIEQLARDGITGGCGPGLYCPDAPVTRGQMAVFILRAIHGAAFAPPAATGTRFTDVPADHLFAAWIEELARAGITGGCAPSAYCPDAIVTRAQMAVFLVRAFGLPM